MFAKPRKLLDFWKKEEAEWRVGGGPLGLKIRRNTSNIDFLSRLHVVSLWMETDFEMLSLTKRNYFTLLYFHKEN